MRFNFVWELKANEVDIFAAVSLILGILNLLLAVFWDSIANTRMPYNPGFGWQQVLWVTCSGLYVWWAWAMMYKHGER